MERLIVRVIRIVSEGESGSKLPMLYDIVVEDVVFVWEAWVSNEGVPMSLNEFYWEVLNSVICSVMKGEVISSVGFLSDPNDRSCDMRG